MNWAEANRDIYESGVWKTTWYQARRVLKYPTDLEVYREIITDTHPEVIVETGSAEGGSAAWFAQYAEVISIDLQHPLGVVDKVTWVTGNSLDLAPQVAAMVDGRSCLVSLDSDHNAAHVLAELEAYAHLATSWLVVEDTAVDAYGLNPGMYPDGGPGAAVKTWLTDHPEWRADPNCERWRLGMNPGGWLRR